MFPDLWAPNHINHNMSASNKLNLRSEDSGDNSHAAGGIWPLQNDAKKCTKND